MQPHRFAVQLAHRAMCSKSLANMVTGPPPERGHLLCQAKQLFMDMYKCIIYIYYCIYIYYLFSVQMSQMTTPQKNNSHRLWAPSPAQNETPSQVVLCFSFVGGSECGVFTPSSNTSGWARWPWTWLESWKTSLGRPVASREPRRRAARKELLRWAHQSSVLLGPWGQRKTREFEGARPGTI